MPPFSSAPERGNELYLLHSKLFVIHFRSSSANLDASSLSDSNNLANSVVALIVSRIKCCSSLALSCNVGLSCDLLPIFYVCMFTLF